MNTTSNEKSYFDLHTSGIGYIQRARECPSGAAAVRSLSWHAPSPRWSAAKDPSYRYFDVKVSGAEAKNWSSATSALTIPSSARWCASASATSGAMRTSATRASSKGQAAASLKARLLKAEPLDRAELASSSSTS
jgi:Protein of unknown function (DUF3577).